MRRNVEYQVNENTHTTYAHSQHIWHEHCASWIEQAKQINILKFFYLISMDCRLLFISHLIHLSAARQSWTIHFYNNKLFFSLCVIISSEFVVLLVLFVLLCLSWQSFAHRWDIFRIHLNRIRRRRRNYHVDLNVMNYILGLELAVEHILLWAMAE